MKQQDLRFGHFVEGALIFGRARLAGPVADPPFKTAPVVIKIEKRSFLIVEGRDVHSRPAGCFLHERSFAHSFFSL